MNSTDGPTFHCPRCNQLYAGNVGHDCPAMERAATTGDAIVEARRSVYGDPVQTYIRVAAIMSAILDHEVQPWQAPLLMVAVKLVRTAETPNYSDNSDDIDGYLKMFREIIGDDMVQAKSVADYLEQLAAREAQS